MSKSKSFFIYSTASKTKPKNEIQVLSDWFKPFICTECGKETWEVYTRGICFEDVKEKYKTEKLCAECAIKKVRTTFAPTIFEIVKRNSFKMKKKVIGERDAYGEKAFLSKGFIGYHRQNLWYVKYGEGDKKITMKIYFIRIIKYLFQRTLKNE